MKFRQTTVLFPPLRYTKIVFLRNTRRDEIALAKSAQASFAAENSAISQPPSVRGIHNLAGSIADPKPRRETHHPGGNPGVNRESISHRRHPILVAFLWDLTKETINLPLGSPRGRKGEPEIPSASQRPSCFSEGSICASTCRDNTSTSPQSCTKFI